MRGIKMSWMKKNNNKNGINGISVENNNGIEWKRIRIRLEWVEQKWSWMETNKNRIYWKRIRVRLE